MQNFSINLPSIPSSKIRFKIQNNKSKAFNNREVRFRQNFHYLTEHFVNSFPNLHPLSPKAQPEEDQKSQISTNNSFTFGKKSEEPFRMMVSDNKKNLMVKYQDQYKNYKSKIDGDLKKDKGFSFSKSGRKICPEDSLSKYISQQNSRVKQSSRVMDNYFFNTEESQESEDQNEEKLMLEKRREQKLAKKKYMKKSAVFESEERWKSLERDLGNKNKLGPGQYTIDQHKRKKKKSTNRKHDFTRNPDLILPKLQTVLQMIQDIPNPQQQEEEEEQKKKQIPDKKEVRQSSMFIEGNVNRFGQQVYPIVSPARVPGPGAYYHDDSLQNKANKILILEEQRKLLKEWYNR